MGGDYTKAQSEKSLRSYISSRRIEDATNIHRKLSSRFHPYHILALVFLDGSRQLQWAPIAWFTAINMVDYKVVWLDIVITVKHSKSNAPPSNAPLTQALSAEP